MYMYMYVDLQQCSYLVYFPQVFLIHMFESAISAEPYFYTTAESDRWNQNQKSIHVYKNNKLLKS